MSKTVDALLQKVREGYLKNQEIIRGLFGPKILIDEMALLIGSNDHMYRWLTAIVREPGYEIFNSATDSIQTKPIASVYAAHYWFIRTPFPYRLEMMRIGAGFSPLHSQFTEGEVTNPFAVHASFKCADEEEYASAQVGLRASGFDMALSCTSTYGRFSYYIDSDGDADWYIKPRLNLRDVKK